MPNQKNSETVNELKDAFHHLDRALGCLTRASVKCNSKQRPALNICVRICEMLIRSVFTVRNEE